MLHARSERGEVRDVSRCGFAPGSIVLVCCCNEISYFSFVDLAGGPNPLSPITKARGFCGPDAGRRILHNVLMRAKTLGLTVFLLFQALPVDAKDPSDLPAIAFNQTRFVDVREGYVSLEWNDVLGSESLHKDGGNTLATDASYMVWDERGTVYYRGHLPMAFVSGLPDGDYQFDVAVAARDGQILRHADEPAIVMVRHWSMPQAMSLFTVGLVVFLALIAVIVHGSCSCRRSVRNSGAPTE
ncbi:hypothetical protein Poly21_09890 [Allorhodopirellula heiligendammensis]|uniref:Uncharacterized protein n=2 Tax=Allorhodopirellula heiligendammensis TaxID=2714739 RepID=A0A5C6C2V8_9BACT|nr:hypothetical protein Poly21_09890 [Allorhodopirellula heiligendammensis]